MEKLAFALITVACKLKPYFQAHTIVVQTKKPLRKTMNNPDAVEWMVLWVTELSEFNVQYRLRMEIKAQAMADFVAEFTKKEDKGRGATPWMVQTDGSSNRCTEGIGVVLQSPEGDLITCVVCLQFLTTNNEAKYEAVLMGLDLAEAVESSLVVIYSNSQVIVGHVNGDYETKGEKMKKYLSMVKSRVYQNFLVKFVQIPKEENEQVDCLAKAATAEHIAINNQVLFFVQYSPANDKMDIQVIPKEDHNASRKLKVRASRFILMGDVLYKRGFFYPYLWCLAPNKVDYVIRKVHEGACRNHSRAQSLVHKLIHVGYY